MIIINLNSKYDLSAAQVHYVQSIILGDDYHEPGDSITRLMDEIPIFLLQSDSMPDQERGESNQPPTEWLGFYQHGSCILGVNTPVIGISPERIIQCVGSEEELMLLTAKVIVHEFAHAKMRLHHCSKYTPVDEFYNWMEEPMANLITLEYFNNSRHIRGGRYRQTAHVATIHDPFEFVRGFISGQPDNYRLALDLYDNGVRCWWTWCRHKDDIQKRMKEKQDWLDYVKVNVGITEKSKLSQLFEALCK
jgi:hypothetical protein